jgi:hypothetical protein
MADRLSEPENAQVARLLPSAESVGYRPVDPGELQYETWEYRESYGSAPDPGNVSEPMDGDFGEGESFPRSAGRSDFSGPVVNAPVQVKSARNPAPALAYPAPQLWYTKPEPSETPSGTSAVVWEPASNVDENMAETNFGENRSIAKMKASIDTATGQPQAPKALGKKGK